MRWDIQLGPFSLYEANSLMTAYALLGNVVKLKKASGNKYYVFAVKLIEF